MKDKKKLFGFIKYIFLFIYFFVCLEFVFPAYGMDTFVNFAFSYGIRIGQIPYKEFNLIVPLFGPFIYSLFLLFKTNIIFLYLGQSLLLTAFSAFIFKMLGNKKSLFFIACMLLPFPISFVYTIYPGYNFILLFLIIILLYLEINKKSDKLIGLILGFSILTKQTIGILLLIPTSIYYFKDFKKIFIRYLYALIPIGVFVLYLVFNNCFYEFIDLCFLGLFNFNSNKYIDTFYLILTFIVTFIMIFKFFKSDKKIIYLYLLCYLSVVYPIADNYHIGLYILLALFVFLLDSDFSKIKFIKKIPNITIILISLTITLCFYKCTFDTIGYKFYNFNNFTFTLLNESDAKNFIKLNKFLEKQDKNIINLLPPARNVMYNIYNEEKLNYYYLLNRGNFGYNGEEEIFNKLKSEKNSYYIVENDDRLDKGPLCQYMYEMTDYIKENGEFVKQFGIFEVYYKE